MFVWTPAPQARGLRLRVHQGTDATGPAWLTIDLPAGSSSWAPTLDQCLPGPGPFSWRIGALGEGETIAWSAAVAFRVVAAAPDGSAAPAPAPRLQPGAATIVETRTADGRRLLTSSANAPFGLADAAFAPANCAGTVFADVPAGHPLCAWIEQAAADQVIGACAAGRYCPDDAVTRRQVAMFLEKAMRGTDRWRPEHGDGAAADLVPAAPLATGYSGGLQDMALAIGRDGLGLFTVRVFASRDLQVTHCSDLACSRATSTVLDSAGDVGRSSALAIGADGLGLIAYVDATNSRMKVAHCIDVPCTSAAITTLDAAGEGADPQSIAIGADGLALIAYLGGNGLAVAHCADLACSAISIAPVDPSSNLSRASIALGADGRALLAYTDFIAGDLFVARCSDAACTSAASALLLDAVGADQVALVIGVDGLGLMVFHDDANGSLFAAHCDDLACASAQVSPIDSPADVGPFVSLAVGADGLGVSSYDARAGGLKLAHCADVACSRSTVTTLGPGTDNALAIGADGLPLVAASQGSGVVAVVHCSNLFCAPFFRRR